MQEPISVGQLTRMMKSILEPNFSNVCVVGEISDFKYQKTGHCYFTLKDREAQLPSVIWRSTVSRIRFELKSGLEVVCRGRIEIYPPHGKYQLIVSALEPRGIGSLELAFRQLHERLSQEGLFAQGAKKCLPRSISRVAVVTSSTGAAVRDFLNVLFRRTKRVNVIIVPVQVQGTSASNEIVQALTQLNLMPPEMRPDVIALIRGGGSIEDLWPFNEEKTVRAVVNSKIPIVTGIGHEIDVSLCDLASDLHALTPSDAAVRLTMEDSELLHRLDLLRRRFVQALNHNYGLADNKILRIRDSLLFKDPVRLLLDPREQCLQKLQDRVNQGEQSLVEQKKHQMEKLAARLEALSPLAILARGYSITQNENGLLIRNASEVSMGETIHTRVDQGSITSIVSNTEP